MLRHLHHPYPHHLELGTSRATFPLLSVLHQLGPKIKSDLSSGRTFSAAMAIPSFEATANTVPACEMASMAYSTIVDQYQSSFESAQRDAGSGVCDVYRSSYN